MKEISKAEMEKLINGGYIKNSSNGYINGRGYIVGYYRTRNKRYIEDEYADIAKSNLYKT